ncbi:MAG: DnaA/Hda family protein [Gemmatimonadaceae bacterium]|nr:DnaA/Hda family protein [Gemmatimonadaceae bacterium]
MSGVSGFRFDNFVVGPANRLAVAAARAVAEGPGSVYNPLVIYGGSGLGKTHLLGAIGAHATHLSPELQVESLATEELVRRLSEAIATGQLDALTAALQRSDILLLDDVQFLTGHPETQQVLLRLFNQLQGAGKQIVLTSDRPPQDIPDVDERLVTRLAGGLTVDVASPDFETRVAILDAKCRERSVTLSRTQLEQLAQRDVSSVRELQGMLNRMVAERELLDPGATARPLTPAVAPPASVPVPADAQSMRPTGEFDNFVSRLTVAVQRHVEPPWRTKLTEAAAQYRREGWAVGVIERAAALPDAPDVDGLLGMFAQAVEHLRHLERQALAIDPTLGNQPYFRDVERVREAETIVDRLLAATAPPPQPDRQYTRESLAIGNANQLALRAADVVVAEPATRYNPLVIVGAAGTGKTHLLHALANALADPDGPHRRVACTTASAFSEELILALRDDTVDRWRARYRSADVLCLDGVHFLAGKQRSQEELFHLLNAAKEFGKQVIVTSEAAPRDLPRLEERIRTRLEEGLVVELQRPDAALRAKLATHFFQLLGDDPEPEVIAAIADKEGRSAAELRDIVARVHRTATEAGVSVGPALVHRVLDPGQSSARPDLPTDATDRFFVNPEKVIWEWPDAGARLIEELR